MPAGAASGDGNAGRVAEVGLGDLHVGEKDLAGVERDAAEGGVADGAGLLVDLLEHEVLVAGLFGLDRVPGDALGLELFGCAVEVSEGNAVDGEGGDLVVVEEVDIAGLVENAGNVGGEEELAVAEAEHDGGAHAGGDHFVGLEGGEDADGEGAGHAAGGATDGFFEGKDWPSRQRRFARCAAGDGDDGLGFVGIFEISDGCGGPRRAHLS